MLTRTCNTCGHTGPLEDFIEGKRYKHGRRPWCRSCHAAYTRAYLRTNAEQTKATRARWAQNNPEKRARIVRNHAAKRIGLPGGQAEYDELVMTQCGLCAVCDQSETQVLPTTGEPRRLAVHHDHATGEVIALVCSRCNVGMGMLRDSPALLRRAADLNGRRWRNERDAGVPAGQGVGRGLGAAVPVGDLLGDHR